MIVNFSPLTRRYTLEEFWALPERNDRSHYNLIGGYLFLVPPPDPPHGDLVSRTCGLLMNFLNTMNIEGPVYFPPEPIYQYESSTYLEPDLLYLSKQSRALMGPQHTSADIVFEVLSRTTSVYDRTTKADTYLALGVRELWLVDPITTTIEVRHATTHEESLLWELWRYPRGYSAKSRVLEGWEVSVDEIFRGLEFAG